MNGILRILALIIAVTVLAACGAHYMIKGPEMADIVSNPDAAIKAYVADYHFHDRTGAPVCLNCPAMEGEAVPYIKNALLNQFGRDIIFVNKETDANLIVTPTKLEFNKGWRGPHVVIFATVNGKKISADAYGRTPGQLAPPREDQIYKLLLVSSNLLAEAIKVSVSKINGTVAAQNLPSKISGTFDNNNNSMKIYDKRTEP